MTATNPRFQVQRTGPFQRIVRDTWLDVTAAEFWGPTETAAQLLAETRASELNLPSADPLGFVEKLASHISWAGNEAEEDRGNVLEDVSKILEHYTRQLRGIAVEPLDMPTLYVQAPWVNTHGLGA